MPSKCVLCIDDDTETLRVRELLLGASGYSVLTATSGREALEMLARGTTVDLVLLDYLMPSMNGDELAHKLREWRPSLPLIVLSAVGQLPDSLLKVVDASVQKGQDPAVLLSTLDAVLTQAVGDAGSEKTDPRETVLCVEDEDLQLKMRRHLFEAAGFRVLEAQSVRVALDAFCSNHVDAVVMDYWLSDSGGNGTAVAREMKRMRPNTPIIMLSGFGSLPGEGIFVDSWMRKGEIGPENLVHEVKRLIELRRSTQTHPSTA